MCGRYALYATAEDVRQLFQAADLPLLEPRYNIAPSQPLLVVRADEAAAGAEFAYVDWGFVPHWARDPAGGPAPINARAETAQERPAFRDACRGRRCLAPVSGFYEWREDGPKRKQPLYIRRQDSRLFAVAALWDRWIPPAGGPALETCALLTVEANDLLRPIHPRMPAVLEPEQFAAWLDPRTPWEALQPWLRPTPADWYEWSEVGPLVNSPHYDGPECLQRGQAAKMGFEKPRAEPEEGWLF